MIIENREELRSLKKKVKKLAERENPEDKAWLTLCPICNKPLKEGQNVIATVAGKVHPECVGLMEAEEKD